MELEPADLVRFRNGDPEALASVIRAFDAMVRACARRTLASPFDQDEAVQEVWLHAWRRREQLDVNRLEAFPGWLKTLATRKCIDVARRLGRARVEVASEAAIAAEPAPRPGMDPAEREQLHAAVTEFVAGLKDDQWRAFFHRCFQEQQSFGEIQAALGINQNRCRYLKANLIQQARRCPPLRAALGLPCSDDNAPSDDEEERP